MEKGCIFVETLKLLIMETIKRFAYVSQGRGTKMYTLWVDHTNGSSYVKPRFIKNLSVNKDKAISIAQKYADNCGIELLDESIDELNQIIRVYNWTPTMVTFGKNYGKELRDCEEKFIVWVAKGCPLKDDRSGEWCNNYFGGEDFQQVAQQIAVDMGLGKMEDRVRQTPYFVTNEQYDKTTEKLNEKASENNDHFYTNGQRLQLTLTCTKVTGYDSMYGYVNVYKFVDDDNRVFTYKGANRLYLYTKWVDNWDGKEVSGNDMTLINVGDQVTLTATIKHDDYKGQKSTYIQRIKN